MHAAERPFDSDREFAASAHSPAQTHAYVHEPISAPVRALSRREWGIVGLTWLFVGAAALVASWTARADAWWLHGLWCCAGAVWLGFQLVRCFRRGFAILLMDHLVMFCIAFGLYALVGGSFLAFASNDQIQYATGYYSVNAIAALKVDAVNGLGFGFALMVASVSSGRWFFATARSASRRAARVSVTLALVSVLVIGAIATVYSSLYALGILPGVAQGMFGIASQFVLVGVFLAASDRSEYRRFFRPLAFVLAAALSLLGLLLFSKTVLLTAIGALVGGFALVYPPRVVLALGATAIVAAYSVTSGIVAFGRNSTDALSDLPLRDRWALVLEATTAIGDADPRTTVSPWGRLCYVPAQAAGMDFYDQGAAGDEFELIPWVFVPRLLAPEKPIISKVGPDFHEKVTGKVGSSMGQGIFSAGYYSGGWLGVLAAAGLAGWILAQTSAMASAILTTRATLLLPFALYGLYIAFRIDGSLVVDYVGAFVFLLFPAVGYSMLLPVSARVKRLR